MTAPAAFFDRDGTLNAGLVIDRTPRPPADLASLRLLPGAADAIARCKRAGLLTIGITNQPDVARGVTSRSIVDAINAEVQRALGLDDLWTCFHDDDDRCECRKPLPGLLIGAARRHDIDLDRSVMVGDRWRDVAAGTAAGCATILLGDGYGEPVPPPWRDRAEPDARAADLGQAVDWITSRLATGREP